MKEVVLHALAGWRIASLFVHEDGPGGIFAKFRHFVGVRYDERSNVYGENELAKLFTCTWCLSVWVGFLLALRIKPKRLLRNTFSIAALIVLIDEIVNR